MSPLDVNDLFWLEKTLSRTKLSKEQQKILKGIFWKKMENSPGEIKIDEEFVKKRFDNYLADRMEVCRRFPKEILEAVADIRMLCLGYTTKKVGNMLLKYFEKI